MLLRSEMCSASARLAFALLAGGMSTGAAAEVRISFLNNPEALGDTLGVLRGAGCPKSVGASLQKAVDRDSAEPLQLDLSRFPTPRKGFYEFASASLLVKALPQSLFLTEHGGTISCLDTVILLASGQLRTSLETDTPGGPFLIPAHTTNGVQGIYQVATPEDVWQFSMARWHATETELVFPPSMMKQLVCLNAALHCCAPLPLSGATNLSADVIGKVLRWSWRRDRVVFPTKKEIVMCHAVMGTTPWRSVETIHAGVLFPRRGHYTYIEKAGLSGPFVRLDFERKDDLVVWLEGLFGGVGDEEYYAGYSDYFVTFNASEPRVLHVQKLPSKQ